MGCFAYFTGNAFVCEKCDEIDAKVVRYRKLAGGIIDKLALESIDMLIKDLELQKTLLHPKSKSV